MRDVDTLLDEINGRLTAITVKFPETWAFIWSYQKHVQYALKEPEKANLGKVIKKGREWLSEVMWKHPFLRPDFEKIVEAIDKFEQREFGQTTS